MIPSLVWEDSINVHFSLVKTVLQVFKPGSMTVLFSSLAFESAYTPGLLVIHLCFSVHVLLPLRYRCLRSHSCAEVQCPFSWLVVSPLLNVFDLIKQWLLVS